MAQAEQAKPQKKKPEQAIQPTAGKHLAVVRIRGLVNVRYDIKETMDMLHLYRKNYCTVVDANPSMLGMVQKIKDYATFGEIDDITFKVLIEKRGELFTPTKTPYDKGDKKGIITVDGKMYKPFFRLSPPVGGFERKGIKRSFNLGGALGNRGDKMSNLLKRMI